MLRWAFTRFNNASRSPAASGSLSSRPGQRVVKNFPRVFLRILPQPVARGQRQASRGGGRRIPDAVCGRLGSRCSGLNQGSGGVPAEEAALLLPCPSCGARVSSGWRRDGAARGAAGGRRGGGTNRQLPISQASGEEAHRRGDTFSLRRSYRRASCMRTALLQRPGEEQSQVQASGTGYRPSRNSTRRQTLLNATKMPASH